MAKGTAQGLAESDGVVFQNVPPGSYAARVVKVEDKESSSQSKHPGTPMVSISFRILSDDEALDGRTLFMVQMLPYASWMNEEDNRKQLAAMKRMYVALGLELDGDEYDTDDWIGEECTIVVTEQEYPKGSGTMKNNVSDVLPSE